MENQGGTDLARWLKLSHVCISTPSLPPFGERGGGGGGGGKWLVLSIHISITEHHFILEAFTMTEI